ncbi:DNA/RNA non-specific endonuclease [Thiomicrorhabdus arctica]|uniref:DNA/RNA non-specific endonuclease n=1 Tax=Thiomicrorhabdus arctica TaxID=131540 RepID=UPI0003772F31|nr:DNA/RNA non-specific endonuclease [Thiomicrorhabdus arctica]
MPKYRLLRLLESVFKILPGYLKYFILVILMGGLWFTYESLIARPAMSYMGLPKVESGIAANGWSHVLRNEGYLLEYSETLANPLWVSYKVTARQFKMGKRPNRFKADWRSIAGIHHSDYTRSGYDRGHMAPNYVIASRYGKSAQQETFLMTNITPQKSNLNQKSWQRLEEIIGNDFSKWYGDFWVVTGPIFSDTPQTMKNTQVAIPKAFYKILVKASTPEQPPIALAFIFPQNAKANADLMTFVTSIDEIEVQTGIDFFSKLEDDVEDVLEASQTPEAWRLQNVSKRPSRY